MLSGQFIDKAGNYYTGDRQGLDVAVTKRPSPSHQWNGNTWVLDAKSKALNNIEALEGEQAQYLTKRTFRELALQMFVTAGQETNPIYVALKDIDDKVAVERAKLP
jgi:hypothetical protein